MIRILFLIQTLGGGGAERVLVNLVNHMDKSKYDVTVETMYADGVNKSFLSPDVTYRRKHLFRFHGASKVLRFLPPRLLYRYYVGKEHYDIVVAYMHGIPTRVISGCRDRRIKKVTWIHNGDMEETTLFRSFLRYDSAVKALQSFDAIVPVANSIADALYKKTGIRENVTVCYNTNDIDKIRQMAEEEIELPMKKPVVCSVGRFLWDKGFSRLIAVSHRLHEEGFAHRLMLIGGGGDFEKTKAEAEALGENVIFTGFQTNPYQYMRKADIYVCSSFYEGLCTATIEAVVLGLACISTDVSGAKEILGENNEYGLVVANEEEAIYQGLKRFLSDPALAAHYQQAASDSFHRFSVEETVGQVEALFDRLVGDLS